MARSLKCLFHRKQRALPPQNKRSFLRGFVCSYTRVRRRQFRDNRRHLSQPKKSGKCLKHFQYYIRLLANKAKVSSL